MASQGSMLQRRGGKLKKSVNWQLVEAGSTNDESGDGDDGGDSNPCRCACYDVWVVFHSCIVFLGSLAQIGTFVCILLIAAGFTTIQESTQHTLANTALITDSLKNEPLAAAVVVSAWLSKEFPQLADVFSLTLRNTSATLLNFDAAYMQSNITASISKLQLSFDQLSLGVSRFFGK